MASDEDAGAVATTPPTWFADVRPIVNRHCVGCHTGGGLGPFSLRDFDDVRPRHLALASATATRRMPPWLPDDACQSFHGARRLTADEIAVLRTWSQADGPKGDEATASPAPEPPLPTLEWIDRTVDIGATYVPKPPKAASDDLRCFLIDPGLEEDTFLVGYDVTPTDRTQVLRVTMFEAPLDEARAKDDASPGAGWACANGVGVGAGRVLGTWATTFGSVAFPKGSGLRLRKGQGIALQVDYHLHSVLGVPDRMRVALQLARGTPSKEAEVLLVSPTDIWIPPRTTGHTVTSTISLEKGGTLWAVQPHMHLLGKRLRAELDAGAKSCLLDVPSWDYHWEEMHFYEGGGIDAPPGARVDLTCVYDNPTDQPRKFGFDLYDEMCELVAIVTR